MFKKTVAGKASIDFTSSIHNYAAYITQSCLMHRSDRYICILLGALCLTGTSVYYTRGLKNDHGAFLVHVIASITLYATSLLSLSFAAEENARLQAKLAKSRLRKRPGLRPYQYWPLEHAILSTRVTGLLAGVYTLALPLLLPVEDPIVSVAIRIPTFFYSCKLLDLAVARARKPPVPRGAQDVEAYGLVSWRAHGTNALRLLAETRYASFNIAVDESTRKAVEQKDGDAAWNLLPWLALPLAYLFPAAAEAQVVSGLLGIQLGLEGLHCLLHPRCPNWLFCRPFTSAGFLEFWTCRWHQGAQPFLYNLGYKPARSVVSKFFGPDVGRAAGVLGAFSLSGAWHAWSGAGLTRAEYVWHVSLGLWFLFILQGLGCLVEKHLSRDVRWRRGWRGRLFTAICWVCSVESASIWLRYALTRTSLPGFPEAS